MITGSVGTMDELIAYTVGAGFMVEFTDEKSGLIKTKYTRAGGVRGCVLNIRYTPGVIYAQSFRKRTNDNNAIFYGDGAFLMRYAQKFNAKLSATKKENILD